MRKLLLDNLGLKVLSIIISIALYVYVLDRENPTVTRRVSLPVIAIAVPQGLQVMEMTPDRVEFLLKGRQALLDDVHLAGARAAANLANHDFGEHEVAVTVIGTPPGVTVEGPDEVTVRVKLDTVVVKERPVMVETHGVPAAGFGSVEVTVKPTTVEVRGPAAWMQRVARIVAPVDISDQSATLQLSVPVEARDQSNVRISGLKLTPDTVEVTVSIRHVNTRTVPVKPNLGAPAPGYVVSKVSVEPTAVTVGGNNNVAALDTEKIDISALRGTRTYSVPLKVPEGTNILGTSSAHVTVTVVPASEAPGVSTESRDGNQHPGDAETEQQGAGAGPRSPGISNGRSTATPPGGAAESGYDNGASWQPRQPAHKQKSRRSTSEELSR